MKFRKLFIYSAGGILLAAALLRFIVAAGNAQILALPEPMLGLPIRYTVLLVGGLELAVALICLFGRQTGLQLGWIAWLAVNYGVYWTGLLMAQCSPQATAIGSLTDPLQLSHGLTGLLISLIPFYLLLGSGTAMAALWSKDKVRLRFSREAESHKMSCPACGRHIKFSLQNLGRKIPCPQCQQVITLRRAENLKMPCFFCHEHIEFPAHAIGEKLKCPHCAMDITLKEPATI